MRVSGGPGGVEFWIIPAGVVVGFILTVVVIQVLNKWFIKEEKNEE